MLNNQQSTERKAVGYIFTVISILIWGTTFVSTKVLLVDFSPVEILVFRFLTAYIALWIFSPHILHVRNWRHELLFALCGLSGVTLYQWLENIALSFSYASNVSVIISTAPIFTTIVTRIIFKDGTKLPFRFYIGLFAALLGIALLSFSDITQIHLNPAGDLLALLASASWSVYSVCVKKINDLEFPSIPATRRIFFYALVFMVPITLFSGINLDSAINIARFSKFKNIFNIIFLGVAASATCFIIWNKAICFLGILKTTVFIYLIPVVTLIFSFFVLGEKLSPVAIIGVCVTLGGLLLTEKKTKPSKPV